MEIDPHEEQELTILKLRESNRALAQANTALVQINNERAAIVLGLLSFIFRWKLSTPINFTAETNSIEEARQRWAGNDLEIDDNPMTSRGEGGCWISAWVWVPDRKNGE